MKFLLPLTILFLATGVQSRAADFTEAPHLYWERVPQDRFTKAMAKKPTLDTSGELALLRSLLAVLDIPISSQILVYSATSLQSGIINPTNPRALYFNEDTTVGFIPGGRLELSSLDPEAGMVFFLFDRLNPAAGLPQFTRSDKCLNCHADSPSNDLPGLVVDSVAVNMDGGSLATFRNDEMGHTAALSTRFGGWHLTGGIDLPNSHANRVSKLNGDEMTHFKNPPGTYFDLKRFLLPTSDILPHLVHEHQVGFLNLVIESIYTNRENDAAKLKTLSRKFADYILFKNEAKLPATGVTGDPKYLADFQSAGTPDAKVLREFDLKSRIFKHQVSYYLLTPVWQMVPTSMRKSVQTHLRAEIKDPQVLAALKSGLSDW